MKSRFGAASVLTLCLGLPVHSQPNVDVPQSLVTADSVETSIRTLEFDDGRPDAATLQTVYDHLDFSISATPSAPSRTPCWQRWITDTGAPGPDRGQGGKYLIVLPGHDGELAEGGFYIAHSRTDYALWFASAFLKDKSDPKPAVETIRQGTKI